MRKIERSMVDAVYSARTWHGGNTSSSSMDGVTSAVFLHGNHIADVNRLNGVVKVNAYTLRRWPSVTTKSRLRALGVDVRIRDYIVYVDGVAI